MGSSPDFTEGVIKNILRDFVQRYAKAKLIDIELVEESIPKSMYDLVRTLDQEPYRKLPLTKIPKNSKIKLRVRIVEPRTGREIKGNGKGRDAYVVV